MAIHKIDLFMPPLSQYGVLHHFTQKLFEALRRNAVRCSLLEAKRNDPRPFLEEIFNDPPSCTLSFNGLLPDSQGRFFSDMINIPHVACLVDSPNSFIPLINSRLSIISCIDKNFCEFFKGLGFNQVFFLPHGVEKNLCPDPDRRKEYDVVMLASCIDYEGLRKTWQEKYPRSLCKVMDEAAEAALSESTLPYYQALVQALDRHLSRSNDLDPQKLDFISILDDIEMYIKGKDRIDLVDAIKDARVDIFGSVDTQNSWKKYLGSHSNITIHDPVPFEQALEIIKYSKILLNSTPWIKNGAHERIFAGQACETLVLTSESEYLKEYFQEGESIVYYQPGKYEKANHRINEYLENNSKREQVASKGRQITMEHHTWDHRAMELMERLTPLLERINAKD